MFCDEKMKQRRKKRHHRRRSVENSDEGESQQIEEILPKWKLGLVGAAIFMCFALLYPTVFAPMVNSLLGRNPSVPKNDIHPSMTAQSSPHRHPAAGGGAPSTPNTHHRPHVPHPAMHQQAQPQSGGRGGFTWLLPIYTVGVVVFLMYTLFKIIFKQKKKKRKGRNMLAMSDESEEYEDEWSAGKDKNLKSVQQRLMKTENAMRNILSQLETIAQSSELIGDQQNESEVRPNTSVEANWSVLKAREMEAKLKELKHLSELCKKQKIEAGESVETSELEDDDDENYFDEEDEEFGEESEGDDGELIDSVAEKQLLTTTGFHDVVKHHEIEILLASSKATRSRKKPTRGSEENE